MSNKELFEKVRKEEYPLTEKCAYLDISTTGLFSRRTLGAMIGYLENRFENGMDMQDYLDVWEFTDGTREVIAKMIGADPEEIFFSGSGSDMLNIFSNGIELAENANIVTSGLSFPSTPQNWMNRLGAENVRIAKPENGMIPCEKLFELTDENTAAIALCMVENTSGWRHDIEEISAFCKERGIYLVLDMTQCIGAMKIDVKETPVDFIVATTYKWLGGPFGISFAYISKDTMDKVWPRSFGWTGNENRLDQKEYRVEPAKTAARYETGGLNWMGIKGIDQSARLYLELGADAVQERILELTQYLYDRVSMQAKVGLVGPYPEKNRSCISFLTFPEEWGLTDEMLKADGIRAHVATPSTMRIGIHYFNNEEDIDKLMDWLERRGEK